MTVSKVANALVVSAEMPGAAAQSSTPYGGLWVGGRVTLSDTSLSFAANVRVRPDGDHRIWP